MRKISNGKKYILPAEQDVLITFAPFSNNDGSSKVNKGGRFAVKATYKVDVKKEEKQDKNTENVLRPGETDESYFEKDTNSANKNGGN